MIRVAATSRGRQAGRQAGSWMDGQIFAENDLLKTLFSRTLFFFQVLGVHTHSPQRPFLEYCSFPQYFVPNSVIMTQLAIIDSSKSSSLLDIMISTYRQHRIIENKIRKLYFCMFSTLAMRGEGKRPSVLHLNFFRKCLTEERQMLGKHLY
jgi:hypothetical protein